MNDSYSGPEANPISGHPIGDLQDFEGLAEDESIEYSDKWEINDVLEVWLRMEIADQTINVSVTYQVSLYPPGK